jgi:hypothetical protein
VGAKVFVEGREAFALSDGEDLSFLDETTRP